MKHNSRFAPYTLLAKGDYPSELNITLPFSLVSNDVSRDRLVIMPAYWFMYNMYALARNSWKLGDRDKRPVKTQLLESDHLAPDTVNDIFSALKTMELLAGKQILGEKSGLSVDEYRTTGGKHLKNKDQSLTELYAGANLFEHGNRECVIVKAVQAYQVYREMILIYSIETILEYLKYHPEATAANLSDTMKNAGKRDAYLNIGGQLFKASQIEELKRKITSYEFISWEDVHKFYHAEADRYSADKYQHALSSLSELKGLKELDAPVFNELLKEYLELKQKYVQAIEDSRMKDFSDPFRQMVYENKDEMIAVLGKPGSNSFVKLQKQKFTSLKSEISALQSRWGLS